MNWHWEILVIPLIALGVWILGTLFKSGEEDKAKKGVRRPPGGAGRGAGRRPVTDLDRFLEEARRRRDEEEPPKPRPASSRRAPSRVAPSPVPAPPREVPRVAPPLVRRVEMPVAVPVARPSGQPTRTEPVAEVSARKDPQAEEEPPAVRATASSPILSQLRSLLSKPQTVGTAFVLREIFDRPLCLRRR